MKCIFLHCIVFCIVVILDFLVIETKRSSLANLQEIFSRLPLYQPPVWSGQANSTVIETKSDHCLWGEAWMIGVKKRYRSSTCYSAPK